MSTENNLRTWAAYVLDHHDLGECVADLNAAADLIETMKRQLAEAQKDARRYRWLRDQDYVVASQHPAALIASGTGDALDAAIDAAMEAIRALGSKT